MKQEFEAEQKEIIDRINALKKNLMKVVGHKGKWNKYLGDVTNKVVIHYLTKYVPNSYSVVGPAVYIEGIGIEFDILVVDRNVKPIEFSSAYPKNSVHLAIEVKERGFFYRKAEADRLIEKARDCITGNLEGIPFLYITLHESEKIMRATRQVYGDNAFFLSTASGRNLRMLGGEWGRFVETTCTLLETH